MNLLLVTFFQISSFLLPRDSSKVLNVQQRLQISVDSLATSPFMQNGMLGASIKSLTSGKTLLSYNAQKSLTPASTIKLITSATAFLTLGEDYRYQTNLEYSGEIKNSVLYGNIYIQGAGDPSLGSWRFKDQPDFQALCLSWAKKIKELGIKNIKGQIIGNDTFFEENVLPNKWLWEDIGNYFGAGCSGLNVNENLFTAVFAPSSYAQSATLSKTIPSMESSQILNRVKTDKANTKDKVNIYSTPYQNQIVIQGAIPANKQIKIDGSIPDPALLLANGLLQSLSSYGIKVSDSATSTFNLSKMGVAYQRPEKATLILSNYSPNLKDLARECNYESINLYAESFLKTSSVINNTGRTHEEALTFIKDFWSKKGVKDGFKPKDGSGLSPSTSLTAENLTDVLKIMYSEKTFPAYYASIPVLGVSGTVANLGKKTKAAGNVHAKSGSFDGVRAYSGYFTSKSGETMAFSFILNRFNGEMKEATKALEKLMIMMVEL